MGYNHTRVIFNHTLKLGLVAGLQLLLMHACYIHNYATSKDPRFSFIPIPLRTAGDYPNLSLMHTKLCTMDCIQIVTMVVCIHSCYMLYDKQYMQ